MTLARMRQRSGTAAQWTSVNPVLSTGEFGVETDTGQFKIGDGVSTWTALPYAGVGGGQDSTAAEFDRARALRSFHNALAYRDAAPIDIVVTGDSWIDGYGATRYSRGIPGRVQEYLRRNLQPAGVKGGAGGQPALTANPGYAGLPITATTGTLYNDFGLALGTLWLQNGQTASGSFTGTGFDLVVTSSDTTGTASVVIDGAAPVALNTASGALASGVRLPVRGLASGNHSFTITAQGTVFIEMMLVLDGDENAGIRVWEGGLGGRSVAETLTNFYWDQAISRIDPSLVIIGQGANDWLEGRTPVQFKADYKTYIGRIKDAVDIPNIAANPSFALLAYPQITSAAGWEAFREVIFEVADEDPDAFVIDLEPTFGLWDGTNRGGLMVEDLAHPSDGGYDAAGRHIVNALLAA